MGENGTPPVSGYAPVNGLDLYYEVHGSGGVPMILAHGGFGSTAMVASVAAALAPARQVIAVDLQGHGRTRDIDRAVSLPAFGDDIGALIDHLGLAQVDLVGYSLGAGTMLRAAIQHPAKVRKLVVISTPHRRDGWYPEVLAGMNQVSSAGFEMMRQTPMYAEYAAVAPDPDHFPILMDKMGASMRTSYDWTEEVAALTVPTMLVFGDADGISPARIAEFFGLLGGGQRDGSWDRSGMSTARLAVLPNTTHYEIFDKPELPGLIEGFLDE
ncbi:alpha/beta hydrolase [Nakamurella silvestris]|nr:alpha/beta hydrolase [Nakamurella silvestris]